MAEHVVGAVPASSAATSRRSRRIRQIFDGYQQRAPSNPTDTPQHDTGRVRPRRVGYAMFGPKRERRAHAVDARRYRVALVLLGRAEWREPGVWPAEEGPKLSQKNWPCGFVLQQEVTTAGQWNERRSANTGRQ